MGPKERKVRKEADMEDMESISLEDNVKRMINKFDKFSSKADAQQKSMMEDIASIRDTIKNLLESNKELSKKVVTLEDRIMELEKQGNILAQRQRENNIEIHGIDNQVSDDLLEHKIDNILGMLDIKTDDYEIQGCHRLPRKNGTEPTIIKFTNRRVPELIMQKNID